MLRMTRQGLLGLWTALMLASSVGCASWSPVKSPTSVPTTQSPSPELSPRTPEPVMSSARSNPPGPMVPPPQGYGIPVPQASSATGDLPEITLAHLIQTALENQPRIRSTEATRDAVGARLGTARAGYFPTIGTTIGYNRETSNIAGGISASTGNPIQRSVSGDSVNNQNFTATLSQNVFDSFRREWRVQAAREDLNASDLDLSTIRQSVILNVQQAYYNLLLAGRLVKVTQAAVQRNIQNLNRAKGFFEVGTRPKIDVTRAQVDLANAQLALVRARNQVATTLAALNNAIGVPDHPPYRLKEELEILPATGSLEESIRTALETRTEIRALRARIRSAGASLTLAKRNFLPSLTADANWRYRGQEFPLAPNWLAGVTVTIPVLNPPLLTQLNEAAANLAGAQAGEDITRQNVILEVQQSYADLGGARESIEASEVLLQHARENLELAQGRYEVGVGPLIDVTDAQLALTQAESQNNQALVDFKLAEARLRKAMGLLE